MLLMGVAMGVLLLAGVVLSSPYLYRRAWRGHQQSVEALAKKFGLDSLPVDDRFGALLSGQVDGLELVIEGRSDARQFQTALASGLPREQGVAYVVNGRGQISSRLGLARPTHGSSPEDLLIGDPAFDPEVAVYGHEFMALAVLDPVTRARTSTLIKGLGVVVAGGRVSYFEAVAFVDPKRQAQLVSQLLDLAQRLCLHEDQVPARLLQNLHVEPLPAVRRRLALALFGGFPTHPVTQEAQPQFAVDADPTISFYARACDREQGRNFLKLALTTPTVAVELRAFAAQRLGPKAVTQLLPELSDSLALLVQALDSVRRLGGPELEDQVWPVLSNPHNRARIAAARALGAFGSLRSVPPLHAIRESRIHAAEVRDAARAAIAEIQGRHGHPAEGALSVAQDPAAGALSETPEAGAVSEAPDRSSSV
ncbi:MAG: hypothetical protein IPG45_22160 [Deltaproteobacteria bacterium]|nr:hypothetical protein [Deltaproteobacteria bacterium]